MVYRFTILWALGSARLTLDYWFGNTAEMSQFTFPDWVLCCIEQGESLGRVCYDVRLVSMSDGK